MPSKMLKAEAAEKLMVGFSVGITNPNCNYSYGRSNLELVRLEKGLLFFIYLYESSKKRVKTDLVLWENENEVLKHDHHTKEKSSIEILAHEKFLEASQSKELSNCSQYIRTQTDYDVYRLIRFIRNFGLYYSEQVIRHRPALYRDILLTMIYLVHHLSPKRHVGVEHIYLFLGKTTVQQLLMKKDLLRQLKQPLDVPNVFFNRQMDFHTAWYQFNEKRTNIDFNGLSADFMNYFNRIFIRYYEGRLKSCGMKQVWA